MHVSCLMPTANRAKWIPLAIDCFLHQTFADAELVILDNGNDNTESVIPQHPRIRYIRQPGPRLTTGEMRNLTCSLAEGDLFIHCDDDNSVAPLLPRVPGIDAALYFVVPGICILLAIGILTQKIKAAP